MAGSKVTKTKAFEDIAYILSKTADTLGEELLVELIKIKPAALARAKAGVPVRKTKRQLRYRYGGDLRPPGGLVSLIRAEVDFEARRLSIGLLDSDSRSLGFYGYILDAGRGLKRTRSDLRSRRVLGRTGLNAAYFGKYSRKYTRYISPISPGRYDITFGRAREDIRNLAGPALLTAYDRGVQRLLWGGTVKV